MNAAAPAMQRRKLFGCALLLVILQHGHSFSLTANHCSSFLSVPPTATGSRRRCQRASLRSPSPSALAVIEADEVDFDFDVGLGGVRLAQETSVLVSGTVQHAPGSAAAGMDDLRRYDHVREVPEPAVQSALQTASAKIVCVGRGRELYKDPGETTTKEVTHAPKDAVRDALVGAGTAMDCDAVQINVAGGQDLQYLEVMDAVQHLVLNLDVKTKCKISFRSISGGQFPKGSAAVTVLGWTGEAVTEGSAALAELSDVERSVALGRLFFRDGTYYTVLESDRNDAVG